MEVAMEPCQHCKALIGQPADTEPHDALVVTKQDSTSKATWGQIKSVLETYKCETCGTALIRVLDREEPHARWSIDERT